MEEKEVLPWELLSAIIGYSSLETQNTLRSVSKTMSEEVLNHTQKEVLPFSEIWWKMKGKNRQYKIREISYGSVIHNKSTMYKDVWLDSNGKQHREDNKPASIHWDTGDSPKNKIFKERFMIHGKFHNIDGPAEIILMMKEYSEEEPLQFKEINLYWWVNDVNVAYYVSSEYNRKSRHELTIYNSKLWDTFFASNFDKQPTLNYFGYTFPNEIYVDKHREHI